MPSILKQSDIEELDRYFDKFGHEFPLMQANSHEEAVKHCKECVSKNKSASELYPKLYGSVKGKFV